MIYMICNKESTEKCGWSLSTGVEGKYLAGGSAIFVLDEWVAKIDLLAKNSDLLANGSTLWPTPYNWRMGYNTSVSLTSWASIIISKNKI